MTSADPDHAMRVIVARCPEITPADLAVIERALAGGDADAIPDAIGGLILEALDDLHERLDALQGRLDAMAEAT